MRNLQRFLSSYLLELRLILTHWSFWILTALWLALLAYFVTTRPNATAVTLLASDYTFAVINPLTLVIMILAGVSAIRSSRVGFDMLEKSYPAAAEVWFGRWFATMTTGAILLLPALIVATTRGIGVQFFPSMFVFIRDALVVFGMAASVVYLIHMIIGIKRWTFVAFVMIWLVSGIAPGLLSSSDFAWTPLINFAQVGATGIHYSPVFGRVPMGIFPTLIISTYLGIVLAALAAMGLIVTYRRLHRMSIIAVGTLIVGVAFAGFNSVQFTNEAQAAFQEANRFPNMFEPAKLPEPITRDFTVSSYNITLDMRGNEPVFTTQMIVRNQSAVTLDALTFTLNQKLAIQDMSENYVHDGNTLTVNLETPLVTDGVLELDVTYGGNFQLYDVVSNGRTPSLKTFVTREGINLACDNAWYPLVGEVETHRPYNLVYTQASECRLDNPATFMLNVKGVDDLTLASNLTQSSDGVFTAQDATFVHLIGAKFITEDTIDGITVVSSFDNEAIAWNKVDVTYRPAFEHFQRFYPEQVDSLQIFAERIEAVAIPMVDTTLITDTYWWELEQTDTGTQRDLITVWVDLAASLHGAVQNDLTLNVGYFLWIHHLTSGDAESMQPYLQALPEGDPYLYPQVPHEEQFAVTIALYDVYVSGGEDAVRDVLQDLLANADVLENLSATEIADWMVQS